MFVEWQTIQFLGPEALLLAAASAIFVAGAFTKNRAWWSSAAIVAYAAAAVVLASQPWPAIDFSTTSGPIIVDPMSLGLRWLGLAVGLIFTLVASRSADEEFASEYFGCLMIVAAGIMITSLANELVLLFLGLELISIPTYVLLFLGRRDQASGEATMKYFYLSILSSALLLYGFSFLYGLGKTTIIAGTAVNPGIREALVSSASLGVLAPLATLALVLVLAGLGFKLAIAPLQFYAPDVYQGTTSGNAGLLAVAPKVAGIAAIVRLVVVAMPVTAEFAWQLALVLAMLTMTIGNVCALWQRNIRRLMAYSSIAHGGYLLIGLAAASAVAAAPQGAYGGGVTAMLFYVLVYAIATMGTFAALAYLGSADRDVNHIDELAGVARSQPVIAGALALFMFSLAGLPPLAGFWGKLSLFRSAVELATSGPTTLARWFALLAVVGALNAAVAAAYYLRIVSVMYFQSAAAPVAAAGGALARVAAVICALLVVGVGAWPGRFFDVAAQSESVLRPAARTVQVETVDAPLAVASDSPIANSAN
ncbi:MAG TPA: NADH-quinone oxidoreductase subunit N [Pirellulaceae bacterium]